MTCLVTSGITLFGGRHVADLHRDGALADHRHLHGAAFPRHDLLAGPLTSDDPGGSLVSRASRSGPGAGPVGEPHRRHRHAAAGDTLARPQRNWRMTHVFLGLICAALIPLVLLVVRGSPETAGVAVEAHNPTPRPPALALEHAGKSWTMLQVVSSPAVWIIVMAFVPFSHHQPRRPGQRRAVRQGPRLQPAAAGAADAGDRRRGLGGEAVLRRALGSDGHPHALLHSRRCASAPGFS